MKTSLRIAVVLAFLGLAACTAASTYHTGHDASDSGQDMNDMSNPADNSVTTTR